MIFHFISKTYVILLKLYNFHDFPCYYMCPHTTGSQSKKKKKAHKKKKPTSGMIMALDICRN